MTDVLQLPIKTCPFVDWFKFRRCEVRTCKNYTHRTESRCLGIDRTTPVGNKLISDAELNLYKFQKPVSTRLVSMRRKKAIDRVKSVLILNEYLAYIRVNRKPGTIAYNSELIEQMELNFPLKLNRLHFQNWMWPHLTDPKLWKEFMKGKSGEISEFTLYSLLSIPKEKYVALKEQVKQLRQGEAQ